MIDDPGDRPRRSWTQRAADAQQAGTWYTDGEERIVQPRRTRLARFSIGFCGVIAVSLVLHLVLAVLTGKPNPFADELLDALISGIFPALIIATVWAVPTTKRATRARGER